MLRIYCDTNIFSKLKQNHPSYEQNLKNTFECLKDIMLFTFSDAHLDDLSSSPKEYRDDDLQFLEKYVRDNYFTREVKEKNTFCYIATPLQVYYNKDYDAYNEFFNNPFDINKLFDGIGDGDFEKNVKELMTSIFNMPINSSNKGYHPFDKTDEKSKI